MTALNHTLFDLFLFMVMPEDSTGVINNPLPLLTNQVVRNSLYTMKTILWVGVSVLISIAISVL